MRPGQLHPNELEISVLERIAWDEPRLSGPFSALRVLSREYTGAGSYTTFMREAPKQADDLRPGLTSLLCVPGVPNGMGAVLWCRGTQPKCLELFNLRRRALGWHLFGLLLHRRRCLTTRSSEQAPAMGLPRTFTLDFAGACR